MANPRTVLCITVYMKHFVLALFLLATPVLAQPAFSPEVQADGRVTFRLFAPKATEVRLNCEGVDSARMTNAGQGVWTFTTPPLEPDIYVYSFFADGLHLIDPANPFLKYNLLNTDSQVEVPGPKSLPWEINDVPRGELHRHFYRSAVAGDDRDYVVYTPPGYKPTARKRYPVLYLLHGYSDDATAWSAVGRANVILDNLIARGVARPMIVVMPLGYGDTAVLKGGWTPDKRDPAVWQRNVDNFGDALRGEVMPQVEAEYRVATDRQSRAIAGLSMGGTESLVVGLNHPEQFAWIGSFSAGGLTNYSARFPSLDAAAVARVNLLWIACGRDDHLLAPNQQFCDWLKAKDIPFTWIETPGVHSFRVWRRNLAAFAPLLFQAKR
jgi:enterochelin esterase family protein